MSLLFVQEINKNLKQKILVVDDSICTGDSLSNIKKQLAEMYNDKYEFIYLTIFATRESQNKIDIFKYLYNILIYLPNLNYIISHLVISKLKKTST